MSGPRQLLVLVPCGNHVEGFLYESFARLKIVASQSLVGPHRERDQGITKTRRAQSVNLRVV